MAAGFIGRVGPLAVNSNFHTVLDYPPGQKSIHFGGVSRKWISKSADSGIGEFGHDKRGRILKLDGLSKVWTRSRTHAVPILKSAKVWTRLLYRWYPRKVWHCILEHPTERALISDLKLY